MFPPRGSRQLCIWKNPVQCCLNILGTTLRRSKPYAILSERLQITLHKNILCNITLILLGQHCSGKNPMPCCPRGSRQHCIRKSLLNLSQYFWENFTQVKTLCNNIRFVLVQSCLEPLVQHCIGFPAVQCFRKSIKTICTGFFLTHCFLEPLE